MPNHADNANPPGYTLRRITAGWTILFWASIALHDFLELATHFINPAASIPNYVFNPFSSFLISGIGITLAVMSFGSTPVRGVILSTIFTWVNLLAFPSRLINQALVSLNFSAFTYASLEPRFVLALAGSLYVLVVLWLCLAMLEARLAFLAARCAPTGNDSDSETPKTD